MKKKLKSTTYFDFCFFQRLFALETAVEIRQVNKRFIKLPITLYLEGSCLFRLYFVPC